MKKAKSTAKETLESEDEEVSHHRARIQSNFSRENLADQREGQTMFDFFKRRKKHTLQQEIFKQLKTSNIVRESGWSYREREVEPQTERIDFIQTPHKSKRNNDFSETKLSNIQRLYDEGLATSRPSVSSIGKGRFTQSREPSARTRKNVSIMEVLSPFKRFNKESLNQSYFNTNEDKDITVQQTRSLRKQDKVTMPKDALLNKMALLKDQLQNFTHSGKLFRNKTYALTTSALELLNLVCEDCRNKHSFNRYMLRLSRKTSELRVCIKNVDKLFKQFQAQDPSKDTEDLCTLLKDRLSSLENKAFEQYDKTLQTTREQISEKYEIKLNQLEKQNQRLVQDIESYEKKMAKYQDKFADYTSEQTQKQEQSKRQLRERAEDWNRKLRDAQDKHKAVKEQLQKAIDDIKKLQREHKTLEYQKTSLIKSFEQQRIQVQSAKQHMFLHDMARGKVQYEQHLMEMKRVYELKEAQLLEELRRYEMALKDHELKYRSHCKEEYVTAEQIKIMKTQIEQLRAENRSISVLLKNVEEQSFVLWSALKDIKVLSSRLGLFTKFSRIYEDICFSDIAHR